jgi:hypothetical protein
MLLFNGEGLKETESEDANGILISFVNHHFGPIRGLCFVIKGEEKIKVDAYLDKQPDGTISEIWKNTLLSSRAIEMPMKLIDDLETPPPVVGSFEEGEREILNRIEQGNLTGDPFYFRRFII